ncbi:MAG: hypothetical protein WAU75_21190 [Solirubrobacteraceae bacterium]
MRVWSGSDARVCGPGVAGHPAGGEQSILDLASEPVGEVRGLL